MRTIAILIALLAVGSGLVACAGELDAECNDNAYETCTEDYNDCADGSGQCYQNGGVSQACIDGCFADYCLCLDDFNCELDGSHCEKAI
jgi:hypothetical protein